MADRALRTNAFLTLLVLIVTGCTRTLEDRTPAAARNASRPAESGSSVSPAGRIAGRLVWTGELPVVEPIRGLIAESDGPRWGEKPNPLAPKIDRQTRGVADAVVYLKSYDPKQAKAWPFAPLRVEQRDRGIQISQGGRAGSVGFVRVGEPFEMVSRDAEPHLLRARGGGFFTLPFPEPDKPRERSIDAAGITEFTSAAGYFWGSAEVYSCEHPYYATTDAAGRFTLDGVPPGTYTLVARLRNWKLLGTERDPETGKIMRLIFDTPFRMERIITVTDAASPEIVLTLPK